MQYAKTAVIFPGAENAAAALGRPLCLRQIRARFGKDYVLVDELGRGACGVTVKLYDEIIDETFVCKKYEPYHEEDRETLFGNFVQEIKLLYLLNHENIVRIFSYYIYPEQKTGYILMEHISGENIEAYLLNNPQN